LPRAEGGLDLGAAMRWLGEHGVNTVLSEAGPRVAGALVREGLADRLMIITTPIVGGEGPPALAGVTNTTDLKNVRIRRFGEDIAVEGDL
jgi:diaminohydroxyphosphoribosylaminopyrimidine deaminase/5-amino-6-(5-phosphoribosylamino)uracil reductase